MRDLKPGAAIYGGWGVPLTELHALSARLQHRGEFSGLRSAAADVWLGWRAPVSPTPGEATSLPLAGACSLLNRGELAAHIGEEPDALTDTELLWKLYRAEGPQGFARVNGQFAVALFDAARDAIVLAVDRWASRPLSFAVLPRGYAFATEYKALLALPDVRAAPNASAVAYLQATKYLPLKDGLLADIHSLAPGTWACLEAGKWTATRYATLKLTLTPARSEQHYIGELRKTLLAACERLVDGLDAVGVALSGGLDSTLTVGAVRAVAPRLPLYTFTASFQAGDRMLEQAAETAAHFGTIHREIIIPVDDLPRLLPELVWTMEDPVAREEMLVYLVLASTASETVPFVLHGHLSDMLFAGMPRHALVHAVSRTPLFGKALAELYDYSQTGAAPRSLLGGALVRAYYRGRRTPPLRVLGAAGAAAEKRLCLAQVQPLNALLLDSLRYPTEIGALERLHARYGLAYGSIFHDLDVARCAFEIPDRLKIRGRCRKYILRRAAEGILPGPLASRPKDLVRMPRNPRLQAVFHEMAGQLLAPEAVAERGVFDRDEIARIRQASGSALFAHDTFYHLWTALLTEIWMRTFVDGRGAGPIVIEPPSAEMPDEGRSHRAERAA